MSKTPQPSFIIIGFALFSMFFGSGNLIFPLFLGQIAEGQWIFASLGFFVTAVLLPLLGILAMVVYKGDYGTFFSCCLGKKLGFLAALILLTVWIPLGSGPRCVALAYASMIPYTETTLSVCLFSGLYCIATFFMVYKKSRILDLLGYILTPLLLVCLFLIISKGVNFDALTPDAISSQTAIPLFVRGVTEGYNTMDLIAAFFFSASTIEILRQSSLSESLCLSKTLKASLVAALLLAIIYIGLICLSASHEEPLSHVPKEQLLVQIAKNVLGHQLGMLSAFTVLLACFTTSVALTTVFADFIANKIFKDSRQYLKALMITQVITFGISITGLKGVTAITGPVLTIFYPALMIMIVINIGRKWMPQRNEIAVAPLEELETEVS
ncbi:MAG: branched-chain amino acid transport system II carrier protein [Parachlamydiaceae bacterium]|nr:branched-chain amino acid transport system II carrier protein [Parachlamydiaceae bacterium]